MKIVVSLIALASQIVIIAVLVSLKVAQLYVATVQKDGWVLLATMCVFTGIKFRWTVETVSVTHAGLEKDAIHFVWVVGLV